MAKFSHAAGRWAGTAEVFDGSGRFVGNGADNRNVQALGNGRTKIDVSFVGPFKYSGHYFLQDNGDHRLYEGPANIGYAETLGDSLVDAKAYWPALGMNQRFMLMILPDGNTQLSLALMQRGEQVLYVVVGQNDRVADEGHAAPPSLVNGTAFDLADDPTSGRGAVMLHRSGVWRGQLISVNAAREPTGAREYRETVEASDDVARGGKGDVRVRVVGGDALGQTYDLRLTTNGRQAWTPQPDGLVGSYSLSGGRALSGTFYHLDTRARVWRREVASHDGARKAVLHCFYRGDERIGAQFGMLEFEG